MTDATSSSTPAPAPAPAPGPALAPAPEPTPAPAPTTALLVARARAWARWSVRWPGAFITLFVALQLTLPLHYYLVRRDRHDERFAWRMFSPTRMLRCDLTMTIDDQPVTLNREFHEAWLALAARGRRSVIEAMGHHLCREHPGSAVVARATCRPLTGEPYPMGGFDLCTIPQL